jgi:hypothetical protein
MMTPRDKIHDLKGFERFLRARGFSKSEARLIAGHGYRKLLQLKTSQQGHSRVTTSPVS